MRNMHLDRNPFYFNRGRHPVGVLLIHGWTGSPPEMRPLGEYLAAQGLVVHGVRLPGHGTQPEDLMQVTEHDWTAHVRQALDDLYTECETVFVGGLSMGGLLSLYLGATYRRPLAGLIAMSAPIFVNDWRRWLAPVAPLFTRFIPWTEKSEQGEDVDPETRSRLADYRRYPNISGLHLIRLMNATRPRLGQVRAPLLIMQGQRDRTVLPSSARYIYDHVGSPDKTLVYFDESGHCITVDKEREAVWERAAAWIAAHVPVSAGAG